MERKELYAESISLATQRVEAEVAHALTNAKATIAAFIVVAHEARFTGRVTTTGERQTAIKKVMLRHGMSNGKASAYAKISDAIAVSMVARYGQPDGKELNGFWVAWNAAETAEALCQIAGRYLDEHVPGDKIGEIADACGVVYGANKTATQVNEKLATIRAKGAAGVARKPKAVETAPKPEVLTKEYVFAALCALEAVDAAWVVVRYEAAMAHMANDVTPQEVLAIAA